MPAPSPMVMVVHQQIFFLAHLGSGLSLARKDCRSHCIMPNRLHFHPVSLICTWTIYDSHGLFVTKVQTISHAGAHWGFTPDVTWTAKQKSSAWPLWTFMIVAFTCAPTVLTSNFYCHLEHLSRGWKTPIHNDRILECLLPALWGPAEPSDLLSSFAKPCQAFVTRYW